MLPRLSLYDLHRIIHFIDQRFINLNSFSIWFRKNRSLDLLFRFANPNFSKFRITGFKFSNGSQRRYPKTFGFEIFNFYGQALKFSGFLWMTRKSYKALETDLTWAIFIFDNNFKMMILWNISKRTIQKRRSKVNWINKKKKKRGWKSKKKEEEKKSKWKIFLKMITKRKKSKDQWKNSQ